MSHASPSLRSTQLPIAESTSEFIDQLTAVTDESRLRILSVLERHELTVSELCEVLELPQSTVSRHLRQLGDQGWLQQRPDGVRRFYRQVDEPALADTQRRLWPVLRDAMARDPRQAEDRRRLTRVLAARRLPSQNYFSRAAASWEETRQKLFGGRSDLLAMLRLLPRDLKVADLGCGTGSAAIALAGSVRSVVAIDGSAEMVEIARRRLAAYEGARVEQAPLEDLPLAAGEVDVALLFLALHHTADPLAVLREACRILRPGGRLLVLEARAHEREDLRERFGHVWLGFSERNLAALIERSGFETPRLEAASGGELRGELELVTALALKPNKRSGPIDDSPSHTNKKH